MPGFQETLHEFAEGRLRSGARGHPIVTNPKQALAIAYRVSGQAQDDPPETTDHDAVTLPPSLASLQSGPSARRFEKLKRLGIPVAGDHAK